MPIRAALSGCGMTMWRSSRPERRSAGSIRSGLLVAPTTMIFESPSAGTINAATLVGGRRAIFAAATEIGRDTHASTLAAGDGVAFDSTSFLLQAGEMLGAPNAGSPFVIKVDAATSVPVLYRAWLVPA